MKSKKLRTFIINEKEVIFNQELFRELFLQHASKHGMGIGNYEFEVADALFIDQSSIHNWRMGVNGPGDIEKIRLLANLWNLEYEVLLMEVKTMTTIAKEKSLNDRERNALRNVYVSYLNFLNVFQKTGGFIWNTDNTDFKIAVAYKLYEEAKNILDTEYVDLKASVYDKLKELYNEELTYTLEAYYCEEEGDTPELQIAQTTLLYNDLLGKFREVVDPYLI